MAPRNSLDAWWCLSLCVNPVLRFILLTHQPEITLATAGFNQTDRALSVYLQQQQSSSQEKIWTQGERSRGIWIGTDVTFQTSQPAKVRGEEVEISPSENQKICEKINKGINKWGGKKEGGRRVNEERKERKERKREETKE